MPRKRSSSKEEIDNTGLLLHPAHLRRWIKALPLVNMGETTRQFHELLQSCNQADLPPDLRLGHMALLHKTAELILNHLHRQFITRTPPLPPKSREILYLNQILLKNLAFSYKLAIRDLGQQEKIDTKQLALAIHQAMDFMGRSYLLTTQLYESEPAGLWHDMHALYAFAERYELLDQPISGLQPKSTPTQTIRSTYLRTALLALCDPQTLRQDIATQLDECFRNHGNYVSLHRERPPPPNTGLFITNLELDRPPLRMLPGETPAMPSLRYFHMDEFLGFLRKAGQATTPTISHLSPSLARLLYERYTHNSQRRFPRTSTPGSIPVTIGFTRIWQMIDNTLENISMIFPARGIAKVPALLESSNSSLDFNPSQGNEWSLVNDDQEWRPLRSERLQTLSSPLVAPHSEPPEPWDIWQVLNASPGDFCLYWNGESPTTAQIGELIALQEYEGQNPIWRLGIIRWMHFAPDRGLEAGIALIATHFMIGELQSDTCRSTDRQTSKVLFLPEMTGRNQARVGYRTQWPIWSRANGGCRFRPFTRTIEPETNHRGFSSFCALDLHQRRNRGSTSKESIQASKRNCNG